ncbi:MAG: glutamate--tRNA ligase [Coriobacteriales bacterium]
MTEVRVRFAPSPTGKLHIGGARTAIYNWAYARATGGKFILRIEDTDPERSTQENIDLIVRAMRWLGLDWDEGPEIGGPFGPYLQTQRFDTYKEALAKLEANGSAYPCFCTAEQNEMRREAIQNDGLAAHPDPCRCLSCEERQQRMAAGETYVWRLKVPEDRGMITVHDAVHGDVDFDASLQDDMIIVRSDGSPTYNFAVVCDDVNMEMTHIIRGDDHFSNTPRQILVYEALGYPTPVFAHIPMICGPDGKKLSKRHGAASVEEYRDLGYLADGLFNYLALLGWAPDGETTVFNRDEMAQRFTLDRLSKNPASLDPEKLDWMNGQYIQMMGAQAFAELLAPQLQAAGYSADDRERIEKMYPLVAERVKLVNQAVPMLAYLFEEHPAFDEKSVAKILQKEGAGAKANLLKAAAALETCAWDAEGIEAALRALVEELGVKVKFVFQPVRVAVTGSQVSPPLCESMELLSREDVLARIQHAAELAVD